MSSEAGQGRNRVLWISKETPDHTGHGGQRRQFFQLRELHRSGAAITCMTLAGEQDDASIRSMATVVRVGGRRRRFRRTSDRAFIDAASSSTFDMVVVSHAESWDLLKGKGHTIRHPVLVDFQNVNTRWYERLGESDLAAYWQPIEREICEVASQVLVTSAAEAESLPNARACVAVAGNGVDLAEWPDLTSDAASEDGPVISTFGSWWWDPNKEGLRWFLDEVWPRVRDVFPNVQLHVAGPGSLEQVVELPEGVSVHGWVNSLSEFIARSHLVIICPKGGPGTPMKFAEALASGRPVVATTDGASGDPDSPAPTLSDPVEMADVVCSLLRDPQRRQSLAKACRDYAEQRCDWARTQRPLTDWAVGRPWT